MIETKNQALFTGHLVEPELADSYFEWAGLVSWCMQLMRAYCCRTTDNSTATLFSNLQGPIKPISGIGSCNLGLSPEGLGRRKYLQIIETSILTFQLFLKMDKKKPSSILNLFGNQNQAAIPLQPIQASLQKARSTSP
ncbi:hypothetical protein ACFX10_042798 [Malus domestica]